MANKHLTEDEIKYTVNVESSNAQKKIHELEQQTKKLRSENKERLQQMIKMEAAGKKETDTYKNLKKQYSETGKEIKNLTSQISEHTSKINVLDMTMVQLKKRQKELQRELDNTSQSLNPEAYDVLEKKLQEVGGRMAELKQNAKSFKEILSSDQVNGVVIGNAITKFADFIGNQASKLKDFVAEAAEVGMEMAETSDGVTKAFKDMDQPDLLDNLRKATKGTVNDVQLMTAAVQAKNFRIPLEDLGKYLQFAQLKAQQTGQSVDYMTNSIVTGLGRKSPMILDNLGISAAEISEKTKETGDFMKAVASIVDNQLAEAGDTYISAADKAAQKTAEWENAQRRLGEQLLPLKESYDDFFGDTKVGIINLTTWIVEHRKAILTLIIAYTTFKVAQIALVNAEKIHLALTKGIILAHKAWNAIMMTGRNMLTLLQAGYYALTLNMDKAKASMATLNKTFKANVFGLVITAVTLLAMKLWEMKKATDAAAQAQKALNKIKEDALKQAVEEKLKLENLRKVANDETQSLKDRYTAIGELNRIVPGYNASIDKTTGKYKENKKALDKYIDSLVRFYEIQGAKKQINQLSEQKAKYKVKMEKAKKSLKGAKSAAGFSYTTSYGAVGNTQQDAVSHFQGTIDECANSIKNLNDQIKIIEKAYGNDIRKNAVKETTPPDAPDPDSNNNTHTGKGGHTTNTTTAPNPDDIASKKFSSDRQADIDEANRSYQQDVNNWNMALAQKKVSQEKYDLAMGALKTQHTANILAIETSYTQRSQDIDIKDAEKKKSLQDAQLKNQQAAEQKHFDQQVEAENAYQEALAKVMEQGGVKVELTMEQERDEKLAILSGYYQAALNLAQQNGEDVTALEKAYADAQAQIQEEYEAKRVEKLAQDAEKQKQARESLGFDKQSEYDQQLEQLQQALDNQYITQEEYEKKVQQLKRDSYMKQAQYYTNLFSGAVTALQDAEMANVDAKYDAEIKAAEGNTELQEKLEKKKANEKLKIQKKYADVNFAMQVAQIVSTTAVSIMKAYADLGPVAGSIAAALMGVTGAAQLVVANAERQKVKRMTMSNAGGSSSSASGARVASGRESGGSIDVEREQDGKRFHAKYDPDKRGFIDKPTVIVGEGPRGKSKEWVASNAAVENPTVAPLLNIIDQAQRAGNIRTFDLGKYLMAMQGKALGGYVDADALKKTSGGFSKNLGTYSEKPREVSGNAYLRSEEALTSLLTDLRDNGIRAYVSLSDLDAKQQIRNQARKYATK
ncbi:MAG TPA: 2-oxoacid:ferredoxin oxidoreductase subunit delta [Prevotella sp.]|nr:2-oxoacid:ferredoxin oxidoreductase subunit delta [Prevotella sp.]